MATEHQLNANRQNSQYSTGPRTEEGQAASSRNALTLGLYTREDYVKPEERDLYKEFCETMYDDLHPRNLLEQSLTSEITGATWRLRRCSAAEADLADYMTADPMLDDKSEKTRRSIERARASSHSLLHRSINQLRKLQTDRLTRAEILSFCPVSVPSSIADYKQIGVAVNAFQRGNQASAAAPSQLQAQLESIMNDSGISPELDEELRAMAMAHEESRLASNCNPPEPTENEASDGPEGHAARAESASIPRNSACPCGSGQKHKRCCGKNAPAVLHKGAKLAA